MVKLAAAADSKFVSERSAGSSPARGTIELHSIMLATRKEIYMSYRKIEVNGQEYEYSVGKSYVKIRYVGAFNKHDVGYVIDDYEVRVRPGDIADYITRNKLKVKSEDKRRKA